MATPQEIKNVRIKFRIANDSKWKDKNAILDAGEIGIVLNNSQTKIEKMLIGRKDGELAKDAIAFYPGEGAQYKLPEATTSKTGGIKINKHYFKMENGMLEPIHLRKSVADEHGIYYNNDNKPSHSAWEMSKDSDLKINGDLYTEDIYANKIKCTDLVNETKTEYNTIGDYVKLRINESQDEEEYVGENITLVKDVYGEPIASFNLFGDTDEEYSLTSFESIPKDQAQISFNNIPKDATEVTGKFSHSSTGDDVDTEIQYNSGEYDALFTLADPESAPSKVDFSGSFKWTGNDQFLTTRSCKLIVENGYYPFETKWHNSLTWDDMDYIEDASLSFEKTFAVEDPSGIFDSGTTYITGFFNDETTNYPIDLMVKYTEEEEVRTADNKYKITAKVEAYDKIANTFKVIINVENNLVEPVDTIKGKLVGVAVICKNTYIIAAEKTFSLEDGQTYTITTGEETPETIETTEGTIANISFINDGGAARIVVNPSIENCETYSFTIDGLWTQSSGIIEELDDECKLYETYTTTWNTALDVKDLTYRLPNENGSIDVVTVADGEEGETNYSSEKIIQVKYENSSGYLTTEVIGYFMDSLLPYLIVEPTQKSTTRYEYTGTTAEIQGKINDETISITLTGSTEEATYKFNARSSTITVTVVDEDNEIAANVYCKYVPYEKLPDVLPTSSFEGTQFHNYIEYSGKYRPTAELSVDNKGNLLFTTDNSTVERNRVLHIDEDVTQGYLTLSSGAVATTWLPELKLELISAKNKKTITFNPNPEGAKPSKTNTIQIHQDYCKTIIVNGKKYAVDDDNTIVLGSTTWTEEKSALLDTAVQKIKFNGEDKVGPEVVIDQKESVVEGSDWIVVDAEEVDNTTTYNVSHATINYRQPTISTPLIFNESNKTKTFNTIITEHIKNGHIEQGAAYEIDLTDIFNKISALEARIASLEAGE